MSILFRYLSLHILTYIGLTLAGLALLFGFFDLIAELGDVRPGGGYTTQLAMLYVALQLPGRVHESLPVATLVGTLLALARLAMNSEFTVMRASGLSLRRLIGYALTLGGALGLCTLLIGEYLAPPADRLAQQIKIRGTARIVAQEFRSGMWAKDGDTFVNIRQLTPDARLVDVRMYEFDEAFNLRLVRRAEQGVWGQDGGWRLRGIGETRLSPGATRAAPRQEMAWRSDITPDLLSALLVNPNKMALSTLNAYIRHLTENGQKATRYEIALWNKLAMPLAVPVMVLLALPFAYFRPRAQNVGGQMMLGIAIGMGFYLLNRLFGHIGLLNDWSPVLSALAPLAFFTATALVALRLAESRRY